MSLLKPLSGLNDGPAVSAALFKPAVELVICVNVDKETQTGLLFYTHTNQLQKSVCECVCLTQPCLYTLTNLPPVCALPVCSMEIIIAAPHITQRQTATVRECLHSLTASMSCKEKDNMGYIEQINSVVVGGWQSPFQSDSVTRKLEPKPMEANKQSPLMLPAAYWRTLSYCTLHVLTLRCFYSFKRGKK